MSNHEFKTPGILRSGFEYQDLVGIETLIAFFRDPNLYLWVALDSDDNSYGYIDDVVAAHPDGTYELTQVKFTPDPEKYFLDWAWLTKRRPNGTSFLQKWSNSLREIRKLGPIHSVRLRTNRRPDIDFSKSLVNEQVNIERIDDPFRTEIETHLGGRIEASQFFETFRFSHSEALIDQLEHQLRASIVPSDTDGTGWLLLREQARRWATRKNQPEPDGRIQHTHLVQIITKKRTRPLPQDFQIPTVYCPPNSAFIDAFFERVSTMIAPISVLWGTPGRGKSTFLSFFMRELAAAEAPFVRHHYFLSLDDTSNDRFSFPEIANSLMAQIGARYPDAVRGLEESPEHLREWITACAEHFATKAQPFVVVIDGLDHVWRESANVAQMEHLFNFLLPPIPNVALIVGTQRVPESQLPHRLLRSASSDDWIEIPAMNETAVNRWIIGQYEAGRIRLTENRLPDRSVEQELGSVGNAFFKISAGHPLHLIYSFEALVRRGASFTSDEVERLPSCPDGDIRSYYRSLWARLSPDARQTIHAIAGSDFRWPSSGLRQCIGSIDDVDHLLDHRRSGLIPFHGSILAFAREDAEHESSFRALLPKIISWLRDEADEYRRWGWLWLMEAKAGDATSLLNNTSRIWVIESLVSGWPASQIITILQEAERQAFVRFDLCRTVQLRSLKTRLLNGPEFQLESFATFQECAIRLSQNLQQVLNFADELPTLSDEQIYTLSRSAPLSEKEIRQECLDELRRRVNSWIQLRHRSTEEFISLSKYLIQTAAQVAPLNLDSFLDFVRSFREADSMFQLLVDSLTRSRRFENLNTLLKVLEQPKETNSRIDVENAMVRVAALEGIDISAAHERGRTTGPLLSCSLHYSGHPTGAAPDSIVSSEDLVQEHYSYGRNESLERYFHNVFFSALAAAQAGLTVPELAPPGDRPGSSAWIDEATVKLQEVAIDVGKMHLPLSFTTPYDATKALAPIENVRPSDAAYTQYQSFTHALRRIATDLHLLSRDDNVVRPLGVHEFRTAQSSPHWSDEAWLADYIENQPIALDPDLTSLILESAIDKEDSTITPFNERAEKWIQLSQFALMQRAAGREELLSRAANCIIGYGWRKDVWVFDVLESIRAVYESTTMDVLPLLRKIVPIVHEICEFTDGDETNHAPVELIDTVGSVCPERLPDFYSHHIMEDEHRFAECTLRAYLRQADLEDLSSHALIRTLLDASELEALRPIADSGNSVAARLLADQSRFLGGITPIQDRSARSKSDDLGRRGSPPVVSEYGPTEFRRLISDTSEGTLGYQHQREALTRWLRHWQDHGRGIDAIACVREYLEGEENPIRAESMLDDVFQASLKLQGKSTAYDWLVQAHIHRHGWASFWTSAEEVLTRLRRAAEIYPERWADFVKDSSLPAHYWERRGSGFSIGTKYLVRFLLMVDQHRLAAELTDAFVRIIEEEVSDQPIKPCPWFA